MSLPAFSEAARPSAAPGHAARWSGANLFYAGLNTYRVTLGHMIRLWTPPDFLRDVESADFVFYLCGVLCVMESYHAVWYTLRQLHRFQAEATLRSVTLIGGGLRVMTAVVKGAPDGTEEEEEGDTTNSRPQSPDFEPTWYEKAKRCACTALHIGGAISLPQSEDDDDDVASDPDSRRLPHHHQQHHHRPPFYPSSPNHLQGHRTMYEDSEVDMLSSGPSMAYDIAGMASQREISQLSTAEVDKRASVSLQQAGEEEEDEDDEEQTWEATPEMLKHYWKQLERAILTAPRHNQRRIFRALPPSMLQVEPDVAAARLWFEKVTQPLHEGTHRGSIFDWLFLHSKRPSTTITSSACAVQEGLQKAANMPETGQAERYAFAVPSAGCFSYRSKPFISDFYPDTEEDEESEDEEEERRTEVGEEPQKQMQDTTRPLPLRTDALSDPEDELPSPRPLWLTEQKASLHATELAAPESAGVPPPASAPAPAPPTTVKTEKLWKRRYELKWEALFLTWFNVSEVPMASREMRALLLKASPPAFMAPAMTRDDGPTDLDVASTNLSILWFWSTLQRVYETLVINEDVEKCDGDIEELQAYAVPLYKKCIARWPVPVQMQATSDVAFHRGLVGLICVPQSAWLMLNSIMQLFLALRRHLYYRNTWSLLRYMYSSSKAKLMSAALITVMMTISSRVSAAGRVVRERIAGYIEAGSEVSADGGVASTSKSASRVSLRIVIGLCAFELTRMAVQYVISNTTSEFIVLTASQRREVVKMQLYEALCHTQLTFYEQHTYEEVEQIIYYVSDMEGIDVQLHQYLFNAIHVLVELRDALQPFNYRSIAVAAAVAMAPYALRRVATMVEHRYLLAQREGYLPSASGGAEEEYQGDDDEANVLREGAMLRGEEIIAAIPQLRPYGADVRLVRWWNRHQQRRQHITLAYQHRHASAGERVGTGSALSSPQRDRHGGGGYDGLTSGPLSPVRRSRSPRGMGNRRGAAGHTHHAPRRSWATRIESFFGNWVTGDDISLVRGAFLALVQLPHGKLIPGTGKAILDLSEWLLPMAAAAYGICWCGQASLDPFQLVQGMQAIEAAVDSVGEAMDTAEMVGYNAYKASMLERLLQPTQWEVISREEEQFMANFTISTSGVAAASDARQTALQNAAASRLSTPGVERTATDGQPQRVTALHPSAVLRTDAATQAARTTGFYRHHTLRHIELRGIRLRNVPVEQRHVRRYNSRAKLSLMTPTTDAEGTTADPASPSSTEGATEAPHTPSDAPLPDSPLTAVAHDNEREVDEEDDEEEEEAEETMVRNDEAPLFSADLLLWSPPQQRGRFICITGPNGGGKTALVNLLLALYINSGGPLPSSVASSPYAGRLGSGSVIFGFAPRTHSRRNKRGNMTSRTQTASAANLSRIARAPSELAARTNTGRSHGLGTQRTHGFPASRSHASFTARSTGAMFSDRFIETGRDTAHTEVRMDIRLIPADVLRRQLFSYVPENPSVFSGATVAQNISLAGYVSVATDALMRRVTLCAELAHCDFVHRLPLGMLTRICDSTAQTWNSAGQYSSGAGNTAVTRLSADQAKRLMLARAYFHGGEVLLLDEPTKEIESAGTAQRMCDGWRKLLERGYFAGVICMTMDETLLKSADEVITLP